jgi:hypothetical protein
MICIKSVKKTEDWLVTLIHFTVILEGSTFFLSMLDQRFLNTRHFMIDLFQGLQGETIND